MSHRLPLSTPAAAPDPVGAERRRMWRRVALLVPLLVTLLALLLSTASFAAADPPGGDRVVIEQVPPDPSVAVQQAVDAGTANAAANDIEQAVSVIDRRTGVVIAGHLGDQAYNTESILKLFTAAYYLVQLADDPDDELRSELRTMITTSDDSIQTALWQWDIVPTIAERYSLTDTANGPASGPQSWGSDRTTADDQASFLYRMSRDPQVGPQLMTWMAATTATAADGFNQSFGLNALTGDHGSKQGWSDPGWSPANLHSVGWTDRYFVAVLQTSPTADYATMRSTSTATAGGVATAAHPVELEPSAAAHRPRGFSRIIRAAYTSSGLERSVAMGLIGSPGPALHDC